MPRRRARKACASSLLVPLSMMNSAWTGGPLGTPTGDGSIGFSETARRAGASLAEGTVGIASRGAVESVASDAAQLGTARAVGDGLECGADGSASPGGAGGAADGSAAVGSAEGARADEAAAGAGDGGAVATGAGGAVRQTGPPVNRRHIRQSSLAAVERAWSLTVLPVATSEIPSAAKEATVTAGGTRSWRAGSAARAERRAGAGASDL